MEIETLVAGLKYDCSSDAATSESLMCSLSVPILRARLTMVARSGAHTRIGLDKRRASQQWCKSMRRKVWARRQHLRRLLRTRWSSNRRRFWSFHREFAGKCLYQNAPRSHSTGRCMIGTIFVCPYGLYEERDDGNKSSLILASHMPRI